MAELIPEIRNAVRAVIMRERALLVQHKIYEDGRERLTLPGGAPNPGETLRDGLLRECREEIGATIEVEDLMHVADFYKLRDTSPPSKRQQVEFLFRCRVPDDYEACNGPSPDRHQRAVVWLPLDEISTRPLFPSRLREILSEAAESRVYLGLID